MAALVIEDDLGEVELAEPAQRIVTISDESTELVVALGIQPIGITTTRLDVAGGSSLAEDYYIGPDQLGAPELVGTDAVSLEAVALLEPDLIVATGYEETLAELGEIAPVVAFDVQVPGRWQQALTQLGVATGRSDEATSVIDGYAAQVSEAAAELEAIAAANPGLTVVYPNYRGGEDNFVFDANFAIAAVIPELGFDLVGYEVADPAFPGVGLLATERLADLDGVSETVIALGPTDWQDTSSSVILETLGQPVLSVLLDEGRPSTGPLSAPFYLEGFVSALQAQYG